MHFPLEAQLICQLLVCQCGFTVFVFPLYFWSSFVPLKIFM